MKYQKGAFAVVPNIHLMGEITHQAFKVFVALCKYADEEGVAYPSRQSISNLVNLSPNKITSYLKELEEREWIMKEKR